MQTNPAYSSRAGGSHQPHDDPGGSAHDLVVASSRLARGDASVAIRANMHLVALHNMERRRQVAVAAGAESRTRGFASSLEQIAHDGVVLAAAISEPGQDLTRPGTVAARTELGWRIDGRKLFCTIYPLHRPKIDHHAPVARRVAAHPVSPSVHGDLEPVIARGVLTAALTSSGPVQRAITAG